MFTRKIEITITAFLMFIITVLKFIGYIHASSVTGIGINLSNCIFFIATAAAILAYCMYNAKKYFKLYKEKKKESPQE